MVFMEQIIFGKISIKAKKSKWLAFLQATNEVLNDLGREKFKKQVILQFFVYCVNVGI